MAAAAAALLDELMGRNRNTDPNSDAAALKWDNDQVMVLVNYSLVD